MLGAEQVHIKFEKKAAKTAYLPRIVALASVGEIENTNVNEIKAKNYVVAVGIEIPLFEGFATRAKVDKATAKNEALFYKEALINEQIHSQVTQALLEYQRTKLLFNQAKEKLQLASKALQLAQRRYLNKNGLLVEWEEAYRVWLSSEISYADLGFAQKKAVTQLKFVTGTLNTNYNLQSVAKSVSDR